MRAIHGAARRMALLRLGFPPRGRLGGALRPVRSAGGPGRGRAPARRKSALVTEPGQETGVVLVLSPGLVLVHVAVPAPAVTIPMIIGVIPRRPVVPGRVRLRLAPAWQVVIRGLVTGVVMAGVAVVPGRVAVLAGVAGLVGVAVLAGVVIRVGIVLLAVAGLARVVRAG